MVIHRIFRIRNIFENIVELQGRDVIFYCFVKGIRYAVEIRSRLLKPYKGRYLNDSPCLLIKD